MKKIKAEFLKPFGPGILRGQLSNELLDNFTKLSEEVIDKKMKSWNPSLVGAIDDEWKIPELLYKDFKIDSFLDSVILGYTQGLYQDLQKFDSGYLKNNNIKEFSSEVVRGDGWINYMTEGEYNPIHIHSGCSLSSIFYINDYVGDEPIASKGNPNCEDGHTTFVYGSKPGGFQRKQYVRRDETGAHIETAKVQYFDGIHERGHWSIKPKKGEFYIFPAHLYHMVYPFKGKKKRITASINYGVNLNKK